VMTAMAKVRPMVGLRTVSLQVDDQSDAGTRRGAPLQRFH